jgi:hypothetical protein
LQSSAGVYVIIYFIPIVFIGAFFLLNLTLAVINSKFKEEHEKTREKKKLAKLMRGKKN